MKKLVILFFGFLIIVSGIFAVFSGGDTNFNNETNNETEAQSEKATDDTTVSDSLEEQTSNMSTGLGYVDYSNENLAQSSDSKRIVFFHAPWCSVCNFYEGEIEKVGVPSDVTILKVDFDSETALKQQYGVNVQSTFVLLNKQGEVEKSWPFARGLNGIEDLYSQV